MDVKKDLFIDLLIVVNFIMKWYKIIMVLFEFYGI